MHAGPAAAAESAGRIFAFEFEETASTSSHLKTLSWALQMGLNRPKDDQTD